MLPLPMRCPTCKNEHQPASIRLGPFCSSRCQLIDLGQWLNEEYKVPDSATPLSEEDLQKIEASGDERNSG